MIPRITFGLLVVIILSYIAGAKWPMLAQKVGIA